MALPTFVSGISQKLGRVADLSELKHSGISDEVIAALRLRGFERFLWETEDPAQVWSACASASICETGITPEAIDLILISSSSSPLLEVSLRTLKLAGLGRSTMLGISLQDCCAGIAAISIASDLVISAGRGRRILALVPWASPDANRLGPNRDILFSDGTIAFVVSDQQGDFEILAAECSTDPSLVDLDRNSSPKATYLLASLDNLQRTAERTLRRAGIDSSALRAVFCTNGNSIFLDAIGMATATRHLIYRDTLSRFGHVLACDELLGLKTYTDENSTYDGDLFLLLSWAPYTTGACVLRRCIRAAS